MDIKTKIHTVISIVLVSLIAVVAYWAQVPTQHLKAQLIDTDTVLVRIQDFAFDPDIVRIDEDTTVSWLHDESEGNAEVQHTVTSYDPEDVTADGEEFESDLMSLGDTFSQTFTDPGVYYYNCSLHPFMTGKVCVGDESEILDDDCAIDITSPDGVVDEDLKEVLAEDEDLEDELAADEVTLFEAADEDLDTSDLDEDEVTETPATTIQPVVTQPTVVVTQPQVVVTTAEQQISTELADSGPEDFVYIFVALFAIFAARKLAKNSA